MAIARPVTKTIISTGDWGIPITDAVNALDSEFIAYGGQRRPRGAAWGQLAHVSILTSQSGISSTPVDLTSLTLTLTPPAGRRLLVSSLVRFYANNTQQIIGCRINVNGTDVQEYTLWLTGAGFGTTSPMVVVDSTGTAMTIKLRATVNTGTVNTSAQAGLPAWLLVQDIGPA